MHLEERSGLGQDVDSEVRSTLGGHSSDAHLKRVHLEDTTARSTPGGYGGEVDLTGTDNTAGGMSTISIIRDDIPEAQERGWMPRWRIMSTISLDRDDCMGAQDTR